MSAVTLGGRAVTLATITLPASGVWCADVDVDTADEITGRAELVVDGGPTWSGTVVSGGVSHGLWRGRIVGGAGGLRTTLPALAYRNATLADVLRDVLSEAAEVLSPTSADLSYAVALWQRTRGLGASAVAEIALAAGYVWRVLADGTVWMGVETWHDAGELELTLLDRNTRGGIYTISGDTLSLAPGMRLQVRDELGDVFIDVGDVRHVIEPERITTTVWQA